MKHTLSICHVLLLITGGWLWPTIGIGQCLEPEPECPGSLHVGNENTEGPTIPSGIYSTQTVLSSNGNISVMDSATFEGDCIELQAGFEVEMGVDFLAHINPCTPLPQRNTYYINDTDLTNDIYTFAAGSDITGTGSPNNPFGSLKYVIENVTLAQGDTIYVDAGNFDDAFVEIHNAIYHLVIKGAGSSYTIFDNNFSPMESLFMRIYADEIEIEGIAIQEYNFTGGNDGKAISILGAECVELKDVKISNNLAESGNGALFISLGASVDIIDCEINLNAAEDFLEGGGIDVTGTGCLVNILNSTISNNTRYIRQFGGGIYVNGENTVHIDASTITNNFATNGAGVSVENGGDLTIINSCIVNNIAFGENELAKGGAIYLSESNFTAENSVFDSNQAGLFSGVGRGGAVYAEGIETPMVIPNISISQCQLSNNWATEGRDFYITAYGLLINESQFIPGTAAIFDGGNEVLNEFVIIQNSGNPEAEGLINFINTTSPQLIASPSCPIVQLETVICINPIPVGDTIQAFCGGEFPIIADLTAIGTQLEWFDVPQGGMPLNPGHLLIDGMSYYAEDTGGGCSSAGRLRVLVNIYTVGVAEGGAGVDQVICPGASISIGPGSPNFGYTYYWVPVNGLSNPGIPNPVASPTVTTTYQLHTITDTCLVIDEIMIIVEDTPSVDYGQDQNICPDESVSIGGNNPPSYTYSWSPATGLSSTSVANPIATPGVTTTYSVTISSPNCSNSIVDVITVNVSIQVQADAGPDQTICLGENIQIGTAAVNGYSYSWSPATNINDPTLATPTVSPSVSTVYTLLMTSDKCLIQGIDKVEVIVSDTAYADAEEDQTICAGDQVQIGSDPRPGYTYTWQPSFGLSDPNIANPIANPGITTTYTVNVSSPNCPTNGIADVTITVEYPYIADAGVDRTICLGESVSIGGNPIAGLTYSWSPSAGLDDPAIANPTATPANATVYTLVVSSPNCPMLSTDQVIVTITASLLADAGMDQSICQGSSVVLGGIPNSNYTYNWSPTTGLDDPTLANPTANPSTTTTYTVVVSYAGCTNSASDMVQVNVLDQPVADAGVDQYICSGQGVTIGTPGISGYTYSWSPVAGLDDPSIAMPTANPGQTTAYTLIVYSGDCPFYSTSKVIVFVEDAPTINMASPYQICPGQNIQIGTNPQNGYIYQWSPSLGLSDIYISNPIASPASTTLYTVTVSSPYCAYTTTDQVLVNVSDASVADAGPDALLCPGESVQLGGPSQNGYSYTWSPSTGLSATNISNPIASPGQSTTYTLSTLGLGCSQTGTSTVTVSYSNEVVVFPSSKNICMGNSIQLDVIGGISYMWSPGNGLSCTICPNPVATPATTTTYTIQVIDNNGCDHIGSTTVVVSPDLGVSAGQDVTACIGQTIQLQATGATSYSWSPAAGLSCTNCPNPTLIAATNQTYIVTGFKDDCVDTDAVDIIIEAEFSIDFNYVINECDVIFTPTILTLPQYNWGMGEGTSYTTPIVSHSYTYNGPFHVCLEVLGNCGNLIQVCKLIELDDCNCAPDIPDPSPLVKKD